MTPTNPKTPCLRGRIEGIVALVGEIKVPDATERILLAVKEAMPSVVRDSVNAIDKAYNDGWNDYREEMEKRCE